MMFFLTCIKFGNHGFILLSVCRVDIGGREGILCFLSHSYSTGVYLTLNEIVQTCAFTLSIHPGCDTMYNKVSPNTMQLTLTVLSGHYIYIFTCGIPRRFYAYKLYLVLSIFAERSEAYNRNIRVQNLN